MNRRTEPDEDGDDPELWRWLWTTDRVSIAFVREVALSGLIVLLIVGLLFGISGVWPPLVAVESDSMEQQIMTGDLVYIVEPDRFVSEHAVANSGVVPADVAREVEYEQFGRPGDVIIYAPEGETGTTPIIHRAHLWVEEGENWYDRASTDRIGGAENCEELTNCPSPHSGFITHGDNNFYYDQVDQNAGPIKTDWVMARAHLRVPWLGRLRLFIDDVRAGVLFAPVPIP